MSQPDSAAALSAAAERILGQVGHWSETRWTLPRTAVVFALIQRLADLGARAEGRPKRQVPRLPTAQALPDQLSVMITDLLASPATPATLSEAAEAVTAAHRAL